MTIKRFRLALLFSLIFLIILLLILLGIVPTGNGRGPAILHVSIPTGEDKTGIPDPDPWINECWLLNISGTSGTFTVRIEGVSKSVTSYDTHLVIALNHAAYDNFVTLTVGNITMEKNDFKFGAPRPYNLWNWPSDDVYPTWFNDTLVNVGTIPPKGHTNVTVSAAFSNATSARVHFDAYGSTKPSYTPPTKKSHITHNLLSEDSTVLFWLSPIPPPVACFSVSNEKPNVCEMVTFNASCSFDPDGWIVNYTWNFGDCNTTTVEYPIITHYYTKLGEYTATLIVTDNEGLTNGKSKKLWVRAHPLADFTWSPLQPYENQTVRFDASASTPDGGTITSYSWNFGDGRFGTGKTVTHIYTTAGTYKVILNVTDSEGKWDLQSKQLTVKSSYTPSKPVGGNALPIDKTLLSPKINEIPGIILTFILFLSMIIAVILIGLRKKRSGRTLEGLVA